MNENEITVLKVEPGKAPEQVTIPNTLKAMQELVGGHIEVINYQGACLICNEDGKLLGLEPNRRIGQDVITGTFFLANSDLEGSLYSLSEEDLAPLPAAVRTAGSPHAEGCAECVRLQILQYVMIRGGGNYGSI